MPQRDTLTVASATVFLNFRMIFAGWLSQNALNFVWTFYCSPAATRQRLHTWQEIYSWQLAIDDNSCHEDDCARTVTVRRFHLTPFTTIWWSRFLCRCWSYVVGIRQQDINCTVRKPYGHECFRKCPHFIQDLALQQILSSINFFLSYRTDSTDSRTI